MYESLSSPYRQWVEGRAEAVGRPGPDDLILLLVRLEKQRLDLEAVAKHLPPGRPGDRS